MRIWIVAGEYPTPARPISGPFVRDQLEALQGLGHDVRVVHSDPPTLRRIVGRAKAALSREQSAAATTGATPDVLNPASANPWRSRARWLHDSSGRGLAKLSLLRQLDALERGSGLPDVIHAHDVFPAGSAAATWAGRHGIPYVVTIHTTSFMRREYVGDEIRAARRVLDNAAVVIAVSSAGKSGVPLAPEGIRVLGNVVNTNRFRPRSAQARSEGPIVSIGALFPHKDMAGVIRAWALLPDELRQKHPLHILGDGPQMSQLKTLAAGLEPPVSLPGRLVPDDVAALLARTSLLVSASRVETFGVTMIEALAAGIPFVATKSGGPLDIWTPSAGVMVELDHSDQDLADAISAALADDALQAADNDRRRDAVERFSPAAIAMQLEAMYAGAVRA